MLEPGILSGHLLKDGVPDWDAITFDVLCPRCRYNIRTLTRPKCTECGLDFEWPKLLHRTGFRSPFLFEHNWQNHAIRSYFETLWRARNPWDFWHELSIHDRVHPGPLVFMLLSAPVVLWAVMAPVAVWTRAVFELVRRVITPKDYFWQPWWRQDSQVLQDRIDDVLQFLSTLLSGETRILAGFAGAFIAAQVLSMLLVLLCRRTLGQLRIRWAHVLRVFAYLSGPIAVWWAILTVLCSVSGLIGTRQDGLLGAATVAAFLAVPSVYLAVAARLYLGVVRPRLLGALAYLFAFLILGCVAVALGFH